MHGAQGDDVVVGAAIAHHADGFNRQKDGEGLGCEVIPAFAAVGFDGGAQLLHEDGVGLAQQIGVFLFHFAQDAHTQAGAGEGVAVDHVVGQAQGHAEFAHFVLEQIAQRLQQFQAQLFGQAADVVVAFDDDGFFAFGAAAFDHVGVNRALGQEGGAFACGVAGFEFFGFGLENIDEELADDFSLLLGVAHAFEGIEKELAGIDAHHFGVELAREHVHDHVAFVQAQQAVIDEHAGELVANGAVNERGGHG